MKYDRLAILCALLLIVPGCQALAGALVSYVDHWVNGPQGQVRKSGQLEGGEQQGDWVFHYPSGSKMAEGPYKDDVRFGSWIEYFENGQPKSAGSYDEEGARTNLWTFYAESGQPKARGTFLHDQEHGSWTFWERGQKTQGLYESGQRLGLWTSWHVDGRPSAQGCYHDGRQVGTWHLWTAAGEASAIDYPSPAAVEVVHETWPDGTPRRMGMLEDGVQVGAWATWHRNGAPRLTCGLRDGMPAGSWSIHRADGTQLADGWMTGGMLDDWRTWHGETSKPEGRAPLPQRPPSMATEWSAAALADAQPPADVLAAWLAEMRGPRQSAVASASRSPVALRPSAQQLAALAAEPRVVPALQPAWTEREAEEFDDYVQAYGEGVTKRAPWAGRYGSGGRRSEGKASNRDGLVGQRCPFDELQTVDGGVTRLSDYAGKKVLVVILRGYFGAVCIYCVAQTTALEEHRQKLAAMGTEVLVVYPGPRESQQAFQEAYEAENEVPPYRVRYDPGLELVQQLGISGGKIAHPTTLLIDEQGIIRYAYTGEHAADRPAAQKLIELIEQLDKS